MELDGAELLPSAKSIADVGLLLYKLLAGAVVGVGVGCGFAR